MRVEMKSEATLGTTARPSLSAIFLLVAGSFIFVLAKSIASQGEVMVSHLQYWLIGLLPFIALRIYAQVVQRRKGAPASVAGIHYALIWISILIMFIFLHATHFSENVQQPIEEAFGYAQSHWPDAFFSLAYVLLGMLACLFLFALWGLKNKENSRVSFASLAGLVFFNSGMFFLLVYVIPASLG